MALERIEPRHLDGPEALTALILDGDAELAGDTLPPESGQRLPIVALVGSEVPSHLSRLFRLQVSAHITKPVRSVGVLTALFFARQAFHEQRELYGKLEKAEARLKGRRFVFAAQMALMRELDISEAAAFARLRGAAMERRTTIEELCKALAEENRGVASFT